ncbi:MAG: Glucose-6-phosphate isomerase [Alphaproteobacteria bacterium MarineAlpha4_Bin2]|nr:MAG: Glucose-6-phosphate isomerase [Alphaproteobacteria bacterium MarineAlpha4_Bin2]
MPYKHIIDNCFVNRIGAGGVSADCFRRFLAKGSAALSEITGSADQETQAILRIPEQHKDLETIQPVADQLRECCKDLLVVGTGGSSLGARTLCALSQTATPRLWFLENIDPDGVDPIFDNLDPKRTGAVFISKSGSTTETVGLTMIVLEWLLENTSSNAPSERCVAITERGDNPLHDLARGYKFSVLEHDPFIGGRFSVFSSVGLLPAAVAGLDIAAIRQGARELAETCLKDPASAAPVAGASLAAAFADELDISISVLMPYRDRLAGLALWYRQLWAESLGKEGRGTTPVQATGTVDQHSQLQLYLDGPADKWISLVTCPAANTGRTIPADLASEAGQGHLAGKALGDLLDAFSSATAEALAQHGRPVRELRLDALDERSLGALMMHFVLETLITARLWNVNPFGQPAVETGKTLAMSRLAGPKGRLA